MMSSTSAHLRLAAPFDVFFHSCAPRRLVRYDVSRNSLGHYNGEHPINEPLILVRERDAIKSLEVAEGFNQTGCGKRLVGHYRPCGHEIREGHDVPALAPPVK